MKKAKLTIDKSSRLSAVDKRIYGSFIEHLGRAVYGGIYEPGHPEADGEGFRKDVLKLVRNLNVSNVRYPGGNFVSNFFWEDSVGPAEKRSPRLELAWTSLEPNTFGLDEFSRWAEKAGTDVMMAVNLGTRGIADACNLLEYCNFPGGTKYSDLRRSYGRENPYGFKLWCLGNEMDGPWQIGHKTMQEYGRLSAETAKAMKMIDPSIELVSCGSSYKDMPTFPEWERVTLTENYDYVDYISLHQYYGNQENDSSDFLAKSDDLDAFIRTVTGICDEVQEKRGGKKKINLSFDEWNVWYHSAAEQEDIQKNHPWQTAPPLLEDHYNFEDALLVGEMMITLLRHADRVKIACLAQLVNVIAPIMTEKGGAAWRQTIYWPFCQASAYGRGEVLSADLESTVHLTAKHGEVSDIVTVPVWNEEKSELVIFAVNRNLSEDVQFEADVRSFGSEFRPVKSVLCCDDLKRENSAEEEPVVPRPDSAVSFVQGKMQTVLKAASWNVIRLMK